MIHLHTHSMYSLRDSIIKPDELIERLKETGQTAVAITDHGGLLAGVTIYKKCKEAGIKYIHGCEMYICDDVEVKDKDNPYYHLVVLCLNDEGRLNLNKLISISEKPDNKYFKPRIDFDLLQKHSNGLLILSACMAGEISRLLENHDYIKAKNTVLKYKRVFGDNYYLEIQSRNDEKQIELNKLIYQLSVDTNTPCVVTCDAHHTWKTDREYQIKYAFNGSYKEDGESYVDCYIQSEDDVRGNLNYFSDDIIDKVIKNTHLIAEKCNVELPLSAPIMPDIDTPKEYKNNKEWLVDICRKGFINKLNINIDTRSLDDKNRYISRDVYDLQNGEYIRTDYIQLAQYEIENYIKRYEYELDNLDRMGFVDYILLVYSYVSKAKRRGIARGSGGGSLVCYVSDITNIDPIEYGLYFERFIDVGALKLLENGEITKKELKIPD